MDIIDNINKMCIDVENIITTKDHFVRMATKQQKILDLCPGGKPDGTCIFTPESWIKWAKKELGY